MRFFFQRYPNIHQCVLKIKLYYDRFLAFASKLPTPLRIILGVFLIIVGGVSFLNPLISGWPMIIGGMAILNKKNPQAMQKIIDQKRIQMRNRLRQKRNTVQSHIPLTETIRTQVKSYRQRLFHGLFD